MIPTAKDYWDTWSGETSKYTPEEIMIEFAKFHVEEALRLASQNAKIDYQSYFFKDGEKCLFKSDTFVDKQSILTAYPKTLIK